MLGENGLATLPIGQRASDPASHGVGCPDVRKLAGGGPRFRYRYTKANGQRDRVAAAPGGRAQPSRWDRNCGGRRRASERTSQLLPRHGMAILPLMRSPSEEGYLSLYVHRCVTENTQEQSVARCNEFLVESEYHPAIWNPGNREAGDQRRNQLSPRPEVSPSQSSATTREKESS